MEYVKRHDIDNFTTSCKRLHKLARSRLIEHQVLKAGFIISRTCVLTEHHKGCIIKSSETTLVSPGTGSEGVYHLSILTTKMIVENATQFVIDVDKGSGVREYIELLKAGIKTDQSQAQTSDSISREKKEQDEDEELPA